MNKIICPVCGVIDAVEEAPWNEEGFSSNDICPCCGTHYGEDDWAETKEERKQLFIKLRKQWIASGMKWKHDYLDDSFSKNHPPVNWNPHDQLKNIPKEFLDADEHY